MFNFFKKKPSKELGRLIGSKLSDKVKELSHLSKTEIAIACGYYRVVKGETYPLFTEFYIASLDAKCITLGPRRKLSYIATVRGDGTLLIGTAYTAMMDLHTGDEFEIKLGKNNIRLTRVGALDI